MNDEMLKLAEEAEAGANETWRPNLRAILKKCASVLRTTATSAEPVAYGIYSVGCGTRHLADAKVIKDDEWLADDNCLGDHWGGNIPLYTHPTAAAEQCAQLAESHFGASRSPDYDEACKDIARAIRDTAPSAQADDEIVAALEELEQANEELAASRPQAVYDAMIAGRQEDQLLALDRARARARAILAKAKGGRR